MKKKAKEYDFTIHSKNEKLFTLNDVVWDFVKKYKLSTNSTEEYESKRIEQYRKAIQKFAQNIKNEDGTSLLESAKARGAKMLKDKRSQYCFTYDERSNIILSKEALEYSLNYTEDEKIKKEVQKKLNLEAEVAETHEKYRQFLKQGGFPEDELYTPVPCTSDDENITSSDIMLTTLFELFYEPLDIKQLGNDLFNSHHYGGNTETLESLESRIRLSDKNHYVTIRKTPNKALEPILDMLADKIADRIFKKMNESTSK